MKTGNQMHYGDTISRWLLYVGPWWLKCLLIFLFFFVAFRGFSVVYFKVKMENACWANPSSSARSVMIKIMMPSWNGISRLLSQNNLFTFKTLLVYITFPYVHNCSRLKLNFQLNAPMALKQCWHMLRSLLNLLSLSTSFFAIGPCVAKRKFF